MIAGEGNAHFSGMYSDFLSNAPQVVLESSQPQENGSLPIIDISPFVNTAGPEDLERKAAIAREVHAACRDVGFM